MMQNKFKALMLLGGLFIVGCASKTSVNTEGLESTRNKQLLAINEWTVKGRISINTPDDSFIGNLSWQRKPAAQRFRLYGSIGQTYAELTQDMKRAELKMSDGREFASRNINAMLEEHLGYPLPLDEMVHWIKGYSPAKDKAQITRDEDGLIELLSYRQWQIEYRSYQKAEAFSEILMPSRLTITDGEVKIKLSLRDWASESGLE